MEVGAGEEAGQASEAWLWRQGVHLAGAGRGWKSTQGCEVSPRLVLPSHLTYLPCFSPECCNNQKLLLEYEKYQELQLKSQRMQEEYEKQLRDNDETKSQALEELTEFYEAKLQEKTTLLEEVLTEAKLGPPSMAPSCRPGLGAAQTAVGSLVSPPFPSPTSFQPVPSDP